MTYAHVLSFLLLIVQCPLAMTYPPRFAAIGDRYEEFNGSLEILAEAELIDPEEDEYYA